MISYVIYRKCCCSYRGPHHHKKYPGFQTVNNYCTFCLKKQMKKLDPRENKSLRKRLRIRSVISVKYHYITVLCMFNLLIRLKYYNTV